MKIKTALTALGIGAGVAYFFDPKQGESRRTLLRDKANNLVNQMDDSIYAAVEDTRNKTRGVLSEWTAKLSNQDNPDWVLAERVRNTLGRLTPHSRGVRVRAQDGQIHLSGSILNDEKDAILRAASRTRGVRDVIDELEVFYSPEEMSAFQDVSSSKSQNVPAWGQQNLSPTTRLLSSVGGSLLTLYGLKRKGLAGPVLSTAGLLLTARGMTNLDTNSLLGLGTRGNGIRVQKTVNINAPIDEVYRFWHNFENFPLFMDHVKEISVQNGISSWKVAGPAGSSMEFQSHITRDIPNESIAWETIPDSQIHHIGVVRFEENWDGGTRVTVQMTYMPPAGVVGHKVAELFGVDPRQAMQDDLMRLKALLEVNRMTVNETTAGTSERTTLS
ncbi:MAG TPA: SRPBCC family protein [Anaerolineales bacterium]